MDEHEQAMETYRQIRLSAVTESGRAVNPTYADIDWVDPSARESVRSNGDRLTVEERTHQAAMGLHVIEGFYGVLTPIAMLAVAQAMFGFLSPSDQEILDGYQGVDVDPWGETRELPEDVREELGRAGWHLDRALTALEEGKPVEQADD